MCSSKLQKQKSTCSNRIPLLERRNSLISNTTTTTIPLVTASSPTTSNTTVHDEDQQTTSFQAKLSPNSFATTTPPLSPTGNLKSPTRFPAIKKSKHDKLPIGKPNCNKHSSSVIVEAPGTIAANRREQVTIMQEQRKLRIAHYGRKNGSKLKTLIRDTDISSKEIGSSSNANAVQLSEKRCSFITPNSDPIYVTYHDEEWGVPVHDDEMLFELLVLTGAQVGSDWTSVLRKREDLRMAFSGFDAEIVSKFSEKKIVSISSDYGIELSQVRGVVDNSKRILQMKKEFGSFDNYLWGFVNHKPMQTGYKWCNKIPVKTSKSESISKDMVKKGFRLVGPTVIHSFMQAAGLTNDHLLTCPRHSQLCTQIPNQTPLLPSHHHLPNTTTLTDSLRPSLIAAAE